MWPAPALFSNVLCSGTPGGVSEWSAIDPDRRSVIVAGHRGDEETARNGLRSPDASVRVAAIGALVRLGTFDEAAALPMFADPDPSVRRRLAEALPSILWANPADHENAMVELLNDEDVSVIEMAAWALGEMDPPVGDSVEALTQTGLEHPDPLCREAAVAALGSLGHPAGAAAVLQALEGDIATVRRRAVLALAAFEGDEIEAALTTALGDRDWQVRQGAEDLLGIEADGADHDEAGVQDDGPPTRVELTIDALEAAGDAMWTTALGQAGGPGAEEPSPDDPG